MKNLSPIVLFVALTVCPAFAQETGDGKLEGLTRELQEVREEIDAAKETIQSLSRKLAASQRDLEYKDTEANALYKEIKALEERLVYLRGQLQAHLRTLPGIKEIESERRAAFRGLQGLRDKERAILDEIALFAGRAVEQ